MAVSQVEHYSPNAKPTSDIERDKPYRIDDFVEAMNARHISKFTGSKFNYMDIVGYLKRGCLPRSYGGYILEKMEAGSEVYVIMKHERAKHYGTSPIHNLD